MVWLTGPAGAGKTAIMGTVCDRLKEKGQLAATFYFSSHKGSELHSKRSFVTTLAYQLQGHPALKDRIASGMMLNIQQDPALFQMSLKEQVDALILRPLRESARSDASASLSLVIAVDGIDECGEVQYDSHRSREKDQIEVLSALLQAARDPLFPCRILIASRPEKWIRRFFDETAAGQAVEIFLDDKYSPDDDIRLYLKSNFARLCREYGYDPSSWPREKDIQKLVTDASGQFIYAATVIRFIDTAWPLPKDQLNIVLRLRPPAGASPFRALDALYTAILKSSPAPTETILWLKAVELIISQSRDHTIQCSAWTIDRLFEATSGQSKTILGLPSLVYQKKLSEKRSDFLCTLKFKPAGNPLIRPDGCCSAYSFYHKSFLDFLGDEGRSGTVISGVKLADVERWIWERFSKVLGCKHCSPYP